MNDDRRDSNRHECVVNITYIFDDGTSFKVSSDKNLAQTVNINERGMAIKTDRFLQISDSVKFKIENIDEEFSAKVVWCKREPIYIEDKEQYTCGISYEEVIAERVNEILKQIIDGFDVTKSGQKNEPS